MSPLSLDTHGRGSGSPGLCRPLRWQLLALRVRREPSESVEGDRPVTNLSQLIFGFLPFPFICSWRRHTVAKKRLYQDPLLQNNGFCLSAIGGYRSFLMYWRHNIFPYFPPAPNWIEFSFRIFVSCSSFSEGSGFLPTHPIISLNSF